MHCFRAASHVAPNETAFAQVDWNQWDPQSISTSKLLFLTVLTICWMPSQFTAHRDKLPNWMNIVVKYLGSEWT